MKKIILLLIFSILATWVKVEAQEDPFDPIIKSHSKFGCQQFTIII